MKSLTTNEITEAKQLVDNIRKWKKAYYSGKPIVSDQVYDGAEMRLQKLIPNHPVFSEVGAAADGFETINYVAQGVDKMLSLDKVYNAREVVSFVGKQHYVAMVKLDGLSLRAVYENSNLVCAHTRGNGSVGDVVTGNFYFVSGSIPSKFPKFSKFSVRGEVVMLIKDFNALNAEKKSRGEELFSNPRNAAAGSLKQKDFMETASRKLTFFAYHLNVPGYTFKTKTEMLLALEEMGFKTPRIKSPAALSGIQQCIDETTKVRSQLPVAIDGLVFEYDEIELHEQLGCTNHHPRYAIAYKFASDSGTTRLVKKEWEVSRTRRIVPVGIIEPIELSGAVCTKVTLHNAKWVKDYRIADGEELVIERAGDVIPHFLETVRQTNEIDEQSVSIPTHCPACNSPVVWDGVDITCPNKQCSGAAEKLIKHYVSKPVVNIEGVGEKLIEQLIQNGYIKTPADLYTLTRPHLLRLEKFGDRKAENVLESINKARTQSKVTFLLSLGVESLGKDVAAKIADLVDLDTLEVKGDITTIDGIADTTARSVINGLKEVKWLADELRKHVTVQDVQQVVVSNVLNGKSFCLSGSVEFEFDGKKYAERTEIQELIKSYGGRIVSGVSKKLDYLVAGPGSGSKSDKAREYGLPILSGDDLLKMLEGK